MGRHPVGLANLDALDFTKGRGLLPAIVQHADSGAVLMLGYMNREARRATLTRQRVVFFSRGRQRLWEKGETSGHTLELAAVHADCDADALLVTARPRGPVCHVGSATCFGDAPRTTGEHLAFLDTLELALAGAGGSDAEVVAEAADLLYHLLVLLRVRGLPFERVIGELRARHAAKP